jgi:hypothetical protein
LDNLIFYTPNRYALAQEIIDLDLVYLFCQATPTLTVDGVEGLYCALVNLASLPPSPNYEVVGYYDENDDVVPVSEAMRVKYNRIHTTPGQLYQTTGLMGTITRTLPKRIGCFNT